MKLLMKMGFKKGEGLGRTGGGVTQALETKLRPKGAGVGVIKEQSEVRDISKKIGHWCMGSGRAVDQDL